MAGRNGQTPPELWAVALNHFQVGRLDESALAYRAFLARVPGHAGGHYNLAVTLKAMGRLDEAAAHYRRTITIRPDNAKAHNNLGAVLAAQARIAEAVAHYDRALALVPDYSNAHYNLGNALREQGDIAGAIDHYRRALLGAPDDAETHNNIGIALAEAGRRDEAIAHYRRALTLRPDYADAHSNLGSALEAQGRLDEAMAAYSEALRLNPACADAHYNLGHALFAQDRVHEAEAHYELALAVAPTHAEAHNNFGLLSQRLSRMDEALARYARAQDLKLDYADAHWNEGLARLLLGDFETGWRKYEWRWRREATPARGLAAPLWDGATLVGKTILLHAEQGAGDTIQFIRYASLVKARGGIVVFECPPALRRLLEGVAGVDRFLSAGDDLPPVDVQAPLLSLPMLLGTRLSSVPADVPYLRPRPDRAEAWRERFTPLARFKVGLVWRGASGHGNDHNRSVAAVVMAELGDVDVDWVSLQIDARPDEIAAFAPMAIYDAGAELTDWADTAAAAAQLDLIITVDTAVAHLAGALGKPVWVLLPFQPDWRWMLGRPDSPWYPSMQLFRQPAPGAWTETLDEVRTALALYARGEEAAPPAPVSAAAVLGRARRLPPVMVVSHERSGTHFLMNALSYAYGYTAAPWIDLDVHNPTVDLSSPSRIAASLQALADDPLLRIVKSHHAAEIFDGELQRITREYRIFYVYRDPASVLTSFWRHLNTLGWDEGPRAVDPLALARAEPRGRLTRYQVRRPQTMLRRWAAHVEGWLALAAEDPHVVPVRYEDLDGVYETTLASFADVLGRDPLEPLLRPPRDVNVITGGAHAPTTPAAAVRRSALLSYCAAEVGPLLERLRCGSPPRPTPHSD